jgi:hypothetical protein
MRRRWVLMIAIVAIASTAGLALYFMRGTGPARAENPNSNMQAIPAAVGVSEQKNVPVYLTGLGTVQAFNTVTVKVRIDGQVDTINFMVGGLILSQALTLYTTPVVFLYLDRVNTWLKSFRRRDGDKTAPLSTQVAEEL